MAMEIPVGTNFLSIGNTIILSLEYKSIPASPGRVYLGRTAVGDNFLTLILVSVMVVSVSIVLIYNRLQNIKNPVCPNIWNSGRRILSSTNHFLSITST